MKTHANLYVVYLIQTNITYRLNFAYIYLYQLHLSMIQHILPSSHIALPSNSTAQYKPKHVTAHKR